MSQHFYGVDSSPCLDCERRVIGCHGTCGDWKDFRAELDRKKQIIKAAQDEERITRDYVKSNACKMKMRAAEMKRKRSR